MWEVKLLPGRAGEGFTTGRVYRTAVRYIHVYLVPSARAAFV